MQHKLILPDDTDPCLKRRCRKPRIRLQSSYPGLPSAHLCPQRCAVFSVCCKDQAREKKARDAGAHRLLHRAHGKLPAVAQGQVDQQRIQPLALARIGDPRDYRQLPWHHLQVASMHPLSALLQIVPGSHLINARASPQRKNQTPSAACGHMCRHRGKRAFCLQFAECCIRPTIAPSAQFSMHALCCRAMILHDSAHGRASCSRHGMQQPATSSSGSTKAGGARCGALCKTRPGFASQNARPRTLCLAHTSLPAPSPGTTWSCKSLQPVSHILLIKLPYVPATCSLRLCRAAWWCSLWRRALVKA